MTHPLDLHPLHEVAQQAWSVIRQEGQPEFVDLPVDYRSRLLRHAESAQSGSFAEGDGPIAAFEQAVKGLLAEPELAPEVKLELVEEAVAEPEPPPKPKRASKKAATKKPAKAPAKPAVKVIKAAAKKR